MLDQTAETWRGVAVLPAQNFEDCVYEGSMIEAATSADDSVEAFRRTLDKNLEASFAERRVVLCEKHAEALRASIDARNRAERPADGGAS